MHWHRRQGRAWARWLITALLLMQWVVAAHACGHALAAASAGMAGDCPHHGQVPAHERALLCKLHCQADAQSVERGGADVDRLVAGALAWQPSLAVAIWPAPVMAVAPPDTVAPRHPTGPPAGTPPLYLSLLALRR